MSITIVNSTTIRVGPEQVSIADVLEYAEAVIEEYGWRQGPRPKLPSGGEPTLENLVEHDMGFTLHDSIGLAMERLSEARGEARTKDRVGGTVDAITRDDVTSKLDLPNGMNDQDWNDQQTTVQPVLNLLRKAREEL